MEPTWQSDCGRYRLFLADCLEALPHVGELDAVVTDPPYGVGLTAKKTKHREHKATQVYEDSEQYVAEQIVPRFTAYMQAAKRAMVTPGLRCLMLYPKPSDFGGVYQPNGAGRGPWGFTCFHPVLYYGKSPTNHKGQKPTTVRATHWISDRNIDHPCPKPTNWMKWMVETASLPDELVCDPFTGSGTTGVACVLSGRRFVGVERESRYFDIAKMRIQDALGIEVPNGKGITQKKLQLC